MLKRRRRRTPVDGRSLRAKSSFKTLRCSTKGCTREVLVDKSAVSVLCWECVQREVGIDPKMLLQKIVPVKKNPGFPRGWHLYKKFVHSDGRVFAKGIEKPKLKGKFPPTVVKINTLTKGQRRRLRDEKKAKRDAKLAKKHKKKMKLLKGQ